MAAKTITAFDRATCAALTERINAALQPLAAELGISIKLGRGTYTAASLSVKLECATIGETGVVMSRAAQEFELYARLNGRDGAMLGKEITVQGRVYTVTGWNHRAPRMPVLAVCKSDGRTYKFRPSVLPEAAAK